MTAQFERLGILGTWDEPYLTMNYKYQAAIVRAFGRFVERGLVYKGKKPVHWCIYCRTALAEAEVEYEATPRRHLRAVSLAPRARRNWPARAGSSGDVTSPC
jgi:isoleucyl-tRNA synthetase